MTSTDIRRQHRCELPLIPYRGIGDIVQCDECGMHFRLRDMVFGQGWVRMTRLGLWWAITRKEDKAAKRD